MLADQLWSHVRWGSTEDLLLLAILAESCKSEVNDLDHVGLVLDENVVELHVSVRDTSHMQIVKCLCDLFEEATADTLLDLPVRALLLHVLVK